MIIYNNIIPDKAKMKPVIANDVRIRDKTENVNTQAVNKDEDLHYECKEACSRKNFYTEKYLNKQMYCSATRDDDSNMQDVVIDEDEYERIESEYADIRYYEMEHNYDKPRRRSDTSNRRYETNDRNDRRSSLDRLEMG
jgi:hypothetical protein